MLDIFALLNHPDLTMENIFKAIQFANAHHAGQVRRATQQPYITHTVAVSYLVAAFKGRSQKFEEIMVAAILHDCLEDTEATFELLVAEFGPLVASLVLELTNDQAAIDKVGKAAYQKKKLLGMSSYALVIKLCDRLHNISDHPTAKMREDTRDLMAFLRENRTLSATHKKIVEEIEVRC